MATFKFTLKVTGLCAFVQKSSEPTMMKVILVDAFNSPHGRHYPAILTRRIYVKSTATRPHNFGFDGNVSGYGDADMVGFILGGDGLTVGQSTTNFEPVKTPLMGKCPTFPFKTNPFDSNSLLWVSPMPGSETMKGTAYQGQAPAIAGLTLTTGKIETGFFASGFRGGVKKILEWQFKDTSGGAPIALNRAVAEVVTITWDISSPMVTLKSSVANRDIVLDPGGSTAIEAWLVNQPIEDIVLDRTQDPRQPDAHFVHFFDLATSTGKYILDPLSAVDCGVDPTGAVSNPRCPVVFFDNHE